MGILQKLLNNGPDLLEWQNAVMPDKRPKLYVNRKQLEVVTLQTVQNSVRIYNDSLRIIEHGYKPDTFFLRLDLAEKELQTLVRIEPYIKYVKAITMQQSMTELMEDFQKKKDQRISDFLFAYYRYTKRKADEMKTERGKQNQFKKFQESLEPFVHRLNKQSKDCFVAMCNQKIEEL